MRHVPKSAYQLTCSASDCTYEGKIYFDTPIGLCPKCNRNTLKHKNLVTQRDES